MGALVGRINAADQGVGKALCRNSPGNAQGDWRIAGNASAHRAMICVSAEILWAKLMGGGAGGTMLPIPASGSPRSHSL